MSTKTIIINLMTNIFDELSHNHMNDYEKVEKEYISAPYNPDVDIFIFLLFTAKDNINALKMRQLKKGIEKFEFEDGIFNSEFDIGNIDNLDILFSGLNSAEKYANKILVTWDHGYGYLMFKNELSPSDKILLEIFNTPWFKANWPEFAGSARLLQPGITMYKDDGYSVNTLKDPELDLWKHLLNNLFISTNITTPVYLSSDFPRNFNPIFPVKKLTALTINELSDAILKSSIKKFDLILMSNCYMQNIDTAYALRNCCNYLIAPQTTFPWESYDFSSLIPPKNGRVDDFFCKSILQKTQKSLEQKLTPASNDVRLDEIGFSCIKTEQSELFFSQLKKIIGFLSDYYFTLSNDIYFAANQICDVSHIEGTNPNEIRLDQIDFFSFLEFLNTRWDKYIIFSNSYTQIKKLFDNNTFILENKKGILFDPKTTAPIPKNVCSGLSIFFPKNKLGYSKSDYLDVFIAEGAQIQTKFSKDFGWGLFLEKFFGQFR